MTHTPSTSANTRLSLPTGDGHHVEATFGGPLDAPATIVYLHGPLGGSADYAAVGLELDSRLDATIAHLVYDQRGHQPTHAGDAPTMEQLLDDLDLVLAHASGEIILVVSSLAVIVVQEWVFRHRHHQLPVAGIVTVAPTTDLPRRRDNGAVGSRQYTLATVTSALVTSGSGGCASTGGVDAAMRLLSSYRGGNADLAVVEEILRQTPTWVLSGRDDPVAVPARVLDFADRVWAEVAIIDTAAHNLARAHPCAVADTILAALRVAHDTARYRAAP
ncbi:alpha/beta fold hydrolase [Nocardia sp. NPDC058658]|uniref:alpha/beta fold hydrolase n=1 Tax=Nocardia sp. NPDC058658 TaxID=3346580 RepID=UPI00364EBC00